MSNSLKSRAVSGMMWSGIGQLVSSGVTFVCNIVLARMLTPDDFGCIGMLAIFLAISAAFINGGFTMALIQKKDITDEDYTTIFWFNLAMSLFFVILLFFLAPSISSFYHLPLLKKVLRVQSLDLIICALQIVPISKFKREIRFKPLAMRNIISAVVATIAAVIMAYCGFGVWTLVYCTLLKSTVNTVLLWIMIDWRPTWHFSFKAWKELFNFGGMMLVASLVDTLYTNVNGLIIGRAFSPKDMGYYAQARKLEEVPSLVMSAVINEVSFSAFAKLQDQKEQLLAGLRYNVRSVAFLCFPLMAMLMSIGTPLFTLLYTEKWLASVPYFQILCLASMLYTLNGVNQSVIKALGKGTLYVVADIIKRVIGISLIFGGIAFGIKGMLWGMVLSTYISFAINGIINSRLTSYSFGMQIRDVLPYYILSLGLGLLLMRIFPLFELNYIVSMGLQALLFIGLYLVLSYVFKLKGLFIYVDIIKGYRK